MSTKARTLLGWEPKIRLREMIEATMGYYIHEYPKLEGAAK